MDVNAYEMLNLTAQAVAIDSFTVNLTGTPVNGHKLMIRIKDNGSARAITWGSAFVASGSVALPTTTVAGKVHHFGFIYDSAINEWVIIASDAAGY